MDKRETTVLVGSVLNGIAKSSRTAEVVMRNLAKRERLRQHTDVERMKINLIRNGEKIVDEEYRNLWKQLEEAGIGSIIYGRKGNPDRFIWHYSLKSVAKSAIEGKDVEVTELPQEKHTVQPKREQSSNLSSPQKNFNENMVYIPLREGYDIKFKVPADLTEKEAKIIQRALEMLSA